MALIHEALAKLKAMLDPIAKNKTHAMQYKYRSIDDVINAMHPLLVELELSTSMNVEDVQFSTTLEKTKTGGERILFRTCCKVIVAIIAKDGSKEVFSAPGVGLSYAEDKDGNKASSAGWKYAIGLGLGIPFADIDDENDGKKAAEVEPPKVDVFAEIRRAEEAAKSAGQAVGPVNAQSVDVNGPCTQTQVDRARELATKIFTNNPKAPKDMTANSFLKSAVERRGKKKLAELTYKEISEVIVGIERKLQADDVPF